MRISDWSSDVCSSDLGAGCASFSPDTEMSRGRAPPAPKFFGAHREGPAVASAILESGGPGDRSVLLFRILPKPGCWHRQVIVSTGLDRKSVVSGKSVSVRVDLGGRRNIKKKKIKNK